MHAQPHLLPFLATALAIALFSLMDALMKGASIEVGAYSALLLRCMAGTVLTLPVWIASRQQVQRARFWPKKAILRLHLLRGAVSTVMALTFFYALVRLPIAEAIALSFIAPLVALYLASLLLGEQVGRKAIFASLLGLGGVLAIAASRLHTGSLAPDAALGVAAVLVSALLYAWNLVLQRRIAQIASASAITLSQNLVMAAILLLFAPWLLVWPDKEALLYILASALLANASILLLSWAYARAETQALVPVEYTGFLWAMLFGWLFFEERISPATLAGAAMIVVGCWIAAPRRRTEQTAL